MISALLKGAKAIFGGGGSQNGVDRVMDVATGIGVFIDEQQFTPEEKAKYHKETTIPAFQAFMDSTVGESTQRSETRRSLAISIIQNWFLMLWVSVVSFAAELAVEAATGIESDHSLSAFVLGVATIAQLLYLVLGVGAFFFGAHINRDMPWARKIVKD